MKRRNLAPGMAMPAKSGGVIGVLANVAEAGESEMACGSYSMSMAA
jgi:hypothetical protein